MDHSVHAPKEYQKHTPLSATKPKQPSSYSFVSPEQHIPSHSIGLYKILIIGCILTACCGSSGLMDFLSLKPPKPPFCLGIIQTMLFYPSFIDDVSVFSHVFPCCPIFVPSFSHRISMGFPSDLAPPLSTSPLAAQRNAHAHAILCDQENTRSPGWIRSPHFCFLTTTGWDS